MDLRMQEPTAFVKPHFPEQEQLKCPRCDSSNTKFCYYNNYNLSQPRHFCKNCRRYWTKGGALRNIPVGGGTRKNTTTKRPSSAVKRSPPPPPPDPTRLQQPNPIESLGFSSLMAASTGHWGDLLEGLNPNGSGLKMIRLGGFGENSDSGRNPDPEKQSHGDSSFWNGGSSSSTNGWSDLAIYTPGSSFQ